MKYKYPNTEHTQHLILSPGTAQIKSSGSWHWSKDIPKFSSKSWNHFGSEPNDPKNWHMGQFKWRFVYFVLRGRNLRREEVLGQIVEALGSLKTPGYWQIHTASLRALVGFQEVHMRVEVVITSAQSNLLNFLNLR